jgi:hypothetical protein
MYQFLEPNTMTFFNKEEHTNDECVISGLELLNDDELDDNSSTDEDGLSCVSFDTTDSLHLSYALNLSRIGGLDGHETQQPGPKAQRSSQTTVTKQERLVKEIKHVTAIPSSDFSTSLELSYIFNLSRLGGLDEHETQQPEPKAQRKLTDNRNTGGAVGERN